MEMRRNLRRVGNSTMVPIPPELLREAGLSVGQEVTIRSERGRIAIEPVEGPLPDLIAFAARFTEQYREALHQLAQ